MPYFYNVASGQSVWTHPNEKIYFEKVKRAKEQLKSASNNGKAKGPSPFTGPKEFGKASDGNRSNAKKRVEENSDSDDDVPLGQRLVAPKETAAAAPAAKPKVVKDDSSDSDRG